MIERRDEVDILHDLILEAYRRGLISEDTKFLDRIHRGDAIENNLILLFATYSTILSQYYTVLEDFFNKFDLDNADTAMLNRIGSLVGLPRLEATPSLVPVIFERNEPATETINIPSGTRLRSETETPVDYQVIRPAEIEVGELKTQTYAQSLVKGPDSRVGVMELTQLLDENLSMYIDRVYNPEASTGGNPPETDEEYRTRLSQWSMHATRGTKSSYENALKQVAGLRDFKIEPQFAGPGSVKVVVDPPYEPVIEYVKDELQGRAQLLDEYVYVVGVKEVPITITLEVEVSTERIMDAFIPILEDRVERAVRTYVNGGIRENGNYYYGLGIGRTLYPSRLTKFLLDEITELENVEITYPDKPIRFAAEERAVLKDVAVNVVRV